jgi:hypothetical protein
MKHPRPSKCPCCKKLFLSDPRNGTRQKYCPGVVCQRESHRVAQAKYRLSPKGRMSAQDRADEVERVREWRARRRARNCERALLRDDCPSQPVAGQPDEPGLAVLRDNWLERNPLIIGLISQISGVLRDDIEPVLKSLHSRGQMILGKGPGIVSQD